MSLSLGGKLMIIYVCIGVVLAAGGTVNHSSNTFTDGSSGLSTAVKDSLPNVNAQTGSANSLLSFIDVLKAVRSFLIFAGTAAIALPALLLDLSIPEVVRLVIGVPVSIAFIIGIVQFARSGN